MEQKDGVFRTDYIFSVNFFGLSTLDKKRGPEGCIDFCYKTKTLGKKPPSLQLFKADRNTTLDFNFDTERSYQIWSSPKKFNEKFNMEWRAVSIRVDVSEPFMLIFKSSFADKTLKDWVMVDNLSVKYTSCENRKAVEGFDPMKKMSRLRRLTRPASKPFTPGSPRSSSCGPSLGSFSRSSSILSPSASSIGSSSRKWISGLLSKGSSSISPASDSSIGLSPRRRIAGLLSRRSSSSSTSRSSLGSSFRGQISRFFSRKSSSKSSTSESSTQKPISG
nr:PREDICTED: uncharacterized protein LOC109035285 [Bemisia tabaci]